MNNVRKNRAVIKKMIIESHTKGFSPMFVGETDVECEMNFYLSLGLDAKGNVLNSDNDSNLVKEEELDNVKENILRW
ncbi:TPA: hypothetical protein ACTW91_004639 [Klebsiella variicola subsp. variicola]|nr:hypothetical protein [Salmonella enterica]MDR6042704.1 hypothetical protein [Escherichia coli]HAX4546823.1 hypothetical protein [Escherichia coli]